MPDSKVSNIINNNAQKSFVMNINNQDYELAIVSFIANGQVYFYSIFKPIEYDHIIYSSEATNIWTIAKQSLKAIIDEIIINYNINIKDYPDIDIFIS